MDKTLADTSISIGLEAQKSAAHTWSGENTSLQLGAIFVEKDDKAFADLSSFIRMQESPVQVHPLHGAFGDHVTTIERLIGMEAAFLFVDPTGWKGAGMKFIAPLAKRPLRDVLVNVMFDDINARNREEMETCYPGRGSLRRPRIEPSAHVGRLITAYPADRIKRGELVWTKWVFCKSSG